MQNHSLFSQTTTPPRWDTNVKEYADVWKYYSEVIVPKIMSDAITSNMPFKDLYRILAATRFKCEWVKKQKPVTLEEMHRFSLLPVDLSALNSSDLNHRFGYFVDEGGGSCEDGIDNKQWSETVVLLFDERIKNRGDGHIGVSGYYVVFGKPRLQHPTGHAIDLLDHVYMKALASDNIFEVLSCLSDLIYALSNFPPVMRGSAAIHKWMFDGILQTKFNFKNSLFPEGCDWLAFYETSESFKDFFTISVVANIISDIFPGKISKVQADSWWKILMSDPSKGLNIQARQQVWNDLQAIIQHLLDGSRLADAQSKILNDLAKTNLTFIVHSARIENICTKLSISMNKANLDPQDVIYLRKLFALSDNTSTYYLASLCVPIPDLQQLWADLEYFRVNMNAYKTQHSLGMDDIPFDLLDEFKDLTNTKFTAITQKHKQKIISQFWLNEFLNSYVGEGVVFSATLKKVMEDASFKKALLNGSCNLRLFANFLHQNMHALNIGALNNIVRLITSNLAIFVAELNKSFPLNDLLNTDINVIKEKIIEALIANFPNKAAAGVGEQLRAELLRNFDMIAEHELVLIALMRSKNGLDCFLDHSGQITKKSLIKGYIELVFGSPVESGLLDKVKDSELDKILRNIMNMYQQIDRNLPKFTTYLSQYQITFDKVALLPRMEQHTLIDCFTDNINLADTANVPEEIADLVSSVGRKRV